MKIGIAMAALLLATVITDLAAKERDAPSDIRHAVVLLASMQGPCVSVQVTGARVLLARENLTALSANHGRAYQTEAERLALIAGNRAKSLLDAISPTQDTSGCAEIAFQNSNDQREAMYLVGQLLEQGQVEVIRDGAKQPERKIVVHDINTPVMGAQNFEFIEGGVFMSYGTWVA